jgi:hypothetical protein
MGNSVMKEMYNVPYVEHLRYQKTIVEIRGQYFSSGMQKDVVVYIAICMERQRVKTEHGHQMSLLQPLPIQEWKWEVVTIDFITKLPRTTKQHDSIMVVVDKLIKVAHFIVVKMTQKATNIVEIYMKEISMLHGVSKEIVSDQDYKFSSKLLKGVVQGIWHKFELQYSLSSTYRWTSKDCQSND